MLTAVTVNNNDNDNDKNITQPIFISSGSFIWLCLLPLGEGDSVTFPGDTKQHYQPTILATLNLTPHTPRNSAMG